MKGVGERMGQDCLLYLLVLYLVDDVNIVYGSVWIVATIGGPLIPGHARSAVHDAEEKCTFKPI